MKKLLFGLLLGFILSIGITYAYRSQKPLRITDFDQKNLVILNETLENLWDVTNGRYSVNLVTSNPDGAIRGNVGDVLLFNNSGTYYIEVCVGGTVWKGTSLSDTP